MNSISLILEYSLFILGMVIFVMSIIAYFNRNKVQDKNDYMHSMDFLWIFHEEYYNEYGKKLCRAGRKVTLLAVLLLVVWLVVKVTI